MRLLSAVPAALALATGAVIAVTWKNINSEENICQLGTMTGTRRRGKSKERELKSFSLLYYFLISRSSRSLAASRLRSSGDFTLIHPGDQVFTEPDSQVSLAQVDRHPPLHLSTAAGCVYTPSPSRTAS